MSLSDSFIPFIIYYVIILPSDCKVSRHTALPAPVLSLDSQHRHTRAAQCPGSESEIFVVTMSTKTARLKKAASAKIQHHIGGLRTTIPAQMCVAGPPVATQLGQLGVNIQQFVKDFNLRTSIFREGVPLPTRTTLNPDRSYNLVVHHPTNTYFLKQAAGVKRGSMQGGKETTGYITR